jgi:mannosylglycerate hydrolase
MGVSTMRCVIVSHTHWDREWYRTFESFRARLVDTVDRVLDLLAADPGYFFQLDGQSAVLEDYLEIRPERRQELAAACRAGRIGVGPWYVQPDSLLPSGETHVRNLLEGRRVAQQLGPCSTQAYTPDSFGHPAQMPQLFGGFGLAPFIYWRGNGNEIQELPSEYRWVAPDGSAIPVYHLAQGYFSAWGLGEDIAAAVARLEQLAGKLGEKPPHDRVLLMNGMDHMLPDATTGQVAEALAERTGWEVERGLLDDFTRDVGEDLPAFEGELVGGRVANLLPGVWSTRSHQKLRNRRCESLLQGWTEPFAALGRGFGATDESPAVRAAWRQLLLNQAHDSLCGCSQDRVHEQMEARFDAAEELATETATRSLERLAGLGPERQMPQGEALEIAVFNPSPHPRTDCVRLPLDGFPAFTSRGIHPLLRANADVRGFRLDDQPARLVPCTGTDRARLGPDRPVYDLEFVAQEVPAFGWRRYRLEPSEPSPELEDRGREISAGDIAVAAADDGTLDVRLGDSRFSGLTALEDIGDRGDTYDFDPVEGQECPVREVVFSRRRHPGGIELLEVQRTLMVPACLAPDRDQRSTQLVPVAVCVEARVAPGLPRVDLVVRVENRARDHRLRMRFPTGSAPAEAFAATTFDTVRRRPGKPDDSQWIQPAPSTFPHQGWICAGGLSVVAPGLPEAEIDAGGAIAVTLLRATGWLSRPDLRTRNGDAGPMLPTPGAQCPGPLEARISLFAGLDPARARDAELGLWAVGAGEHPLLPPGRPWLEIDEPALLLSAFKPAEDGSGDVLRLLNPTDRELRGRIRLGFPVRDVVPVRLDESPVDQPVTRRDRQLELLVPPHALRSLLLRR